MKIAIISDTHDNVVTLEKALAWIKNQNIKEIIHCGDLCAPSILTKVLGPKFQGRIHIVHGNVGDPRLLEEKAKNFPHVTIHGQVGKIKLDRKKITFTHFPEKGRELAETGKYDLVFYGHTHKPWEETLRLAPFGPSSGRGQGKLCRLVNPGTLAGMFYKATFAIYDTEKDLLELKILELL